MKSLLKDDNTTLMIIKKWSDKLAYRITLLFIAVAGLLLLLLLDHTYRAEETRENERRLQHAASIVQRQLSVTINNLTLVAVDLSAFLQVQQNKSNPEAFATFARSLYEHYPALDALVYVGPDLLVRDIYPKLGNEHALGLDLSSRPIAPYLEQAIHEHRLIVDPPHLMSNGQLAVIARVPMFRGDEFLGFAQAVLRITDVVNGEISELQSDLVIQLRDENNNLFLGKERLEGAVESREIAVADGVWTLLVASTRPPDIDNLIVALIWGVGGLIIFLTIRGVHKDYRMRQALKAEVADATYELRWRNEVLEQQIRHRMEAEVNLRKSEQSLRDAQRIAQLGNWECDFATKQARWSDELYRILGFNPQEEEASFEAVLSRVHPEDRDIFKERFAETLEQGHTLELEFRIILPDGAIHYMRCTGMHEENSTGPSQRLVGITQDITVQKLALMALESSEHKYRAVLENASDGIIIAALDGSLLDANRRIQTLLGYSRNELLKLHVSNIHPAEDAEKLRIAFHSMWEHGFSLFEHMLLRKDGTTIPVEVSGTVISFDNQMVAIGIFRDIRERKRTEEELHQHRNHLELMVAQRTAELVSLNSELESFSYSVSHDLRAPLRAINGFSVALKEDYGSQLDTTGRDYLDRITTATGRMGRLIDDLLRLSRTIRAEMHWEMVSLSRIASEVLLELSAAEPERKVHIICAKEIIAMGDPMQFRSLLQNLLGNAWKFTRQRSDPLIEFGMTTHSDKVVYFVRDNGIGFEMKHAGEVFKPFYRLHAEFEYEGSGIGLATVQRIVHRHSGQVWVESEPGAGAAFYFTLGAIE